MYYIKDQELYTATAKVTAMSTLATATYRYAVLGSDAGSAVGDLSYYHPVLSIPGTYSIPLMNSNIPPA